MIETLAKNVREASLILQSLSGQEKNRILEQIKSGLVNAGNVAKEANDKDVQISKALVDSGQLSKSLYQRLDLFGAAGQKFTSLIDGIEDIVRMEDPIGKVTLATQLDENLNLFRVRCPVGSIFVIFEARPEVLIQISCLCIKSGNSVILKGGKEAINTLSVLLQVVQEALATCSVPSTAVQLITSRDEVSQLLKMDKYIDLVIPRGSKSLVTFVQENTRIPVLGHADGLCSIYVDDSADVAKSIPVIIDSKTDYPAACNTVETILVHQNWLPHLADVVQALLDKKVEVRLSADCKSCLGADLAAKVKDAKLEDFHTEFSDLVVAIKSVASLDEAIMHINTHGVDSAGVYWNASTRFADGYRYGFGAEIGVSTNKTHARGPVGLEGLTVYKYQMYGDGQTAGSYGKGKRQYLHRPIPF